MKKITLDRPVENTAPATRKQLPVWLKRLRTAASALFFPMFPVTVKKAAVFLLTWVVAIPASTMLFPSAKDALRDAGLDGAAAERMAPGVRVHVRSDNAIGRLQTIFQSGPFSAWQTRQHIKNDEVLAFTVRLKPAASQLCGIFLKSSGDKFSSTLTAKEIDQIILLHETRHCSNANQDIKDEVINEADADYNAVQELVRETGDTSLRVRYLLDSLNAPPSHATALYLYAKFRDLPTPTGSQTAQAFDAEYEISKAFTSCVKASPATDENAKQACRAEFNVAMEKSGVWTQQAHELVLAAKQYFQTNKLPDLQTTPAPKARSPKVS